MKHKSFDAGKHCRQVLFEHGCSIRIVKSVTYLVFSVPFHSDPAQNLALFLIQSPFVTFHATFL